MPVLWERKNPSVQKPSKLWPCRRWISRTLRLRWLRKAMGDNLQTMQKWVWRFNCLENNKRRFKVINLWGDCGAVGPYPVPVKGWAMKKTKKKFSVKYGWPPLILLILLILPVILWKLASHFVKTGFTQKILRDINTLNYVPIIKS